MKRQKAFNRHKMVQGRHYLPPVTFLLRFLQFNPQTKGDHEDNRDGLGLRADKGRGDQRQARNWQDNATTPKAAK